jgi:hypothetical protein
MNVEEMKGHIREALQAGAAFCSGDGAQIGENIPEALNTAENLGTAQLLFHLADDVDNLDGGVAQSFLSLISRAGDPIKIFDDGQFAEEVVGAIGEPLEGTDDQPWLPQTATDMLRFVIEHSAKPAD